MRDEIDGRLWAEHGRAFGKSLAFLVEQAGVALKRLHEIEFDAPWRHDQSREPHCNI